MRLLMPALCKNLDHVVLTAGTVAEALQLAKGLRFNLCVIDMQLPDDTGIELCQPLRKLQPDVAIFYYSAYADDAVQREALSICGDA